MKNYTRPVASDSNLDAIRKLYRNIEISVDVLQVYLVNVVRAAQELSKKNIMDKNGETYQTFEFMFKNTPKGIDRGTLSAWVVAYTPIRPRFNKGNGHYEGIGWANKGTWDLAGATVNPWWEADPESTRKLQAPKLEKQIKALMTAAAKLAAVSELSVEQIAEKIRDGVTNAEAAISAEMMSDSVVAFADAFARQATHEQHATIQ